MSTTFRSHAASALPETPDDQPDWAPCGRVFEAHLAGNLPHPEVAYLMEFVRSSERGVITALPGRGGARGGA